MTDYTVPSTAERHDKLIEIQKLMIVHFSLEELIQLCFEIGIEYENIPGENVKDSKAREIIKFMDRRDRLDQLLTNLRQYNYPLYMHHQLPILHRHRVGSRPDFRVNQALARGNLKLPAMPGTSNNLTLTAVYKRISPRRQCRPCDRPLTQIASHVRAAIVQSKIASSHIKYANALAIHLHHPPLPQHPVSRANSEMLAGM